MKRKEEVKKHIRNTDGMNNPKKKAVEARKHEIYKACEEIGQEGKVVSPDLISEKTGIPVRTLEKDYYRSIIQRYSPQNKNKIEDSQSKHPEIEILKKDAEYWRAIAQSLLNQNKGLRSLLVERGHDIDPNRFPKIN